MHTRQAWALLPAATLLLCPLAAEAKTFTESLATGKTYVNARVRYEGVEDQAFANEAEAMTVRTRIGYETAPIAGFTALVEMEDIHTLGGMEDYQLPPPPAANPAGDAVIADPEQTELNRVQLRYRGVPRLDMTLGRQRLMFDNQRFIGNVGFRQDEQTFDAFSAIYTGIPDWTMTYAYVDGVNGIMESFDANVSDTLLNVAYGGFTVGKIILYSYMLENQEENLTVLNGGLGYDANDTQGIRFDGGYILPTTVSLRALYRAEFAKQDVELRTGKEYETEYALLEAGMAYTFGGGAYTLTPLIGNEVLGADDSQRAAPNNDTGLYAFQTPYATKHAFNGWVDQFLVTPAQGLDDRYVTVGFDLNAYTTKILLTYHEYESDVEAGALGSKLDLGYETNIQIMKTIGANWTIGTKYGEYQQGDAADVAISKKKDADKVWLWAELNF